MLADPRSRPCYPVRASYPHVIGITDVTVVFDGGAKAVDLQESTMDGFIAKLQPEIKQVAACASALRGSLDRKGWPGGELGRMNRAA